MSIRPLRAAVIGAGWYAAHNHIPVLASRPEVELDGVCRLGADDLERVRDHFGFAYGSESFEQVLARRPDIVVVASPHHLHYAHARAAIEVGAHVLCEKPMTLDPGEAWNLVHLAKQRQRHLLVANGYHYLAQVDVLRQWIAQGAVGDIEHVAVSFISATRDVFFGDRGLKSWQTTFFRPDRTTWQAPEKGGGFAYGQLSHSLALVYFLTGLFPKTVSAHACRREQVDLADAGAVLLSNGAVASISGAAAMPEGHRGLMRLFIAGSEGVLTAEFDRDACEMRLNSGEVERLPLSAGDWIYRCDGPVHALVDLALDRGENLSPGEIGALTSTTISAMLASSFDGGAPKAVSIGAVQ